MDSEAIIREALSKHEMKHSNDLKCSKFSWPEAVWVEKKSSCETGLLLRSCLLSGTLIEGSRGHPHSHHPHQAPTPTPWQASKGPQSCFLVTAGFKESTHPKWHLGLSIYLSQRQNNLNICEDVNFTRQSVRTVSKIENVCRKPGNCFFYHKICLSQFPPFLMSQCSTLSW